MQIPAKNNQRCYRISQYKSWLIKNALMSKIKQSGLQLLHTHTQINADEHDSLKYKTGETLTIKKKRLSKAGASSSQTTKFCYTAFRNTRKYNYVHPSLH